MTVTAWTPSSAMSKTGTQESHPQSRCLSCMKDAVPTQHLQSMGSSCLLRATETQFSGSGAQRQGSGRGGIVGKKQILMPPAGKSLSPQKAVGFGCQRWKVQEGVLA